MSTIDKLMMFHMAVTDMPKAKEFYGEKLGYKITKDYRQDDSHWWVSLEIPAGGTSINLTTAYENMKPGVMKLYFSTSDIENSYKTLKEKGVKVSDQINTDLYGPGSNVKWFEIADPDGNRLLLVQA